MLTEKVKPDSYTRYPISYVFIYNATTILHFLIGGVGIIAGFKFSLEAYLVGLLYLIFAFVQMCLIMPLTVCPNCVYYKIDNSLCISGLNVISRKITVEGDLNNFSKRGKGIFCHNNLYIAALFIPIIAIILALILNFSLFLLALLIIILGLLLYRFFVILPKTACVFCCARNICPNAKSMGI